MEEKITALAQSYELNVESIEDIYKTLVPLLEENMNFTDMDYVVKNGATISTLSTKYSMSSTEIMNLVNSMHKLNNDEHGEEADDNFGDNTTLEDDEQIVLGELFKEGESISDENSPQSPSDEEIPKKTTSIKKESKITFSHIVYGSFGLMSIFIIYGLVSVYSGMNSEKDSVSHVEKKVLNTNAAGGIRYDKPDYGDNKEDIRKTISLASKKRWHTTEEIKSDSAQKETVKQEFQVEHMRPDTHMTDSEMHVQKKHTQSPMPRKAEEAHVTKKIHTQPVSIPEEDDGEFGVEMFSEDKDLESAVCDSFSDSKEYVYFIKKEGEYIPVFEDESWDEKGIILNSRIVVKSIDEINHFAEVSEGKFLPTELFTSCTPIEQQ